MFRALVSWSSRFRLIPALSAAALLTAARADATIIDFAATLPVGDFGSPTYVDLGTGLVATGLYFDDDAVVWLPANLYVRNDDDDHGLGVCNPLEQPCPGPTNGGDVNELDNAGQAELIRMTLPAGFRWVSVQLSSLDDNSKNDPLKLERGVLWTSNFDDPALGFDTDIWLFEAGGPTVEPSFAIPGAFSLAPYLFFQPFDWQNEGLNDNNDFLVWRVEIERVTIPEPGSLALLALGLAALGVLSRKPRE